MQSLLVLHDPIDLIGKSSPGYPNCYQNAKQNQITETTMQKITSSVLSVEKETFVAVPWEFLCNNIHVDHVLLVTYGNVTRDSKRLSGSQDRRTPVISSLSTMPVVLW